MTILLVCFLVLLKFPNILKCESCSEIECSNVIDYVCGEAKKDGARIMKKFLNECHFNKIQCELKDEVELRRVPDIMCGLRNRRKYYHNSGRRLKDFTIVGAIQACNHTCPTYCVDTYEPVCAKIWMSEFSFQSKPMVNHCHVDLLSCAAGVNVTIETLSNCYPNSPLMFFMTQMAAAKSLGLIEDENQHEQETS